MTADDPKRYHRTIEEAWARLKSRPGLLSPREFAVIEEWRRRGIPAALVVDVFDARRRSGASLRSLSYLAAAVDEAWRTVAAGRAAAPASKEPAKASSETWDAALARSDLSPALRALLTRLLASFRKDDDPRALDAELDEALPRLAPADLIAAAERETSEALAPFRGRMPAAELAKTYLRGRADRLRAALGLHRMR